MFTNIYLTTTTSTLITQTTIKGYKILSISQNIMVQLLSIFLTGYQKLDLVPDNNNPLPVKGQIVISLLSRDGHGSGKLEKSIIQCEN